MESNKSEQNGFEKKSERLDIRVSHQKKQAFSKACEDQGDTPSSAVRRFISSYIRRSKRDDFAVSLRSLPWRKAAAALLVLVFVGIGGQRLWTAYGQNQDIKIADKVFEIYDENGNGLIELGEIAPNDNHLHRVLNIDGEEGISRDEFITHATMVWRFVDPENFKIIENKEGLTEHRVVARMGSGFIPSEKAKALMADPNVKKYIMIDGKPVEYKGAETLLENLNSAKADYQMIRELGGLPDFSTDHFQKYRTNFVMFDLRDPNRLELSVFQLQSSGLVSKSIRTFQRSVTWVEGRNTPELVMGVGRDDAILTQDVSVN